MKIENLKVGMEIKNYKALCELLGIPIKSGNTKKAQMKELERFIEYDKKGYSIIVTSIFEKPKPKIDSRKLNGNIAPYIPDAELLLIDLMLSGDGELLLPNSKLFKLLNMVNNNYGKFYGNNRPLLANDLNIDIELVNDYYNNVNAALSRNINTIINRLEAKYLLFHKNVVMIRYVEASTDSFNDSNAPKLDVHTYTDKNGVERVNYSVAQIKTREVIREATTDELRKILRIHRETMLELGLNVDDKYNVLYREGLTHKFNKIVNYRLITECNILRSFKAHHLIFNNDHLEMERMSLLSEIERQLIQDNVNIELRKRILDNARNRSNKASKTIIECLDNDRDVQNKEYIRSNISYIEGHELLNSYLIYNRLTPSQAKQIKAIQAIEIEEIELELPELM